MGNLHAGHLQLVKRARSLGGRIIVSVFVNPTQFAPGEDYATYPRSLADDSRQLEAEQVDLLFTPAVDAIYPEGVSVDPVLHLPAVAEGLETDFRPGFFAGVATVVKRLFELVQPDAAVFGEKDYQQLVVVRALVQQLHWPIEIIGVATVREPDGLAMSSRNQYLSADERQRAPGLYRTLCLTAERLRAGENPAALEAAAMQALTADGFVPDYVSIRRAQDLEPVSGGNSGRAVVLAAARLGRTRLIDNVIV
jgi:pantoate--beta-alanine ligase